MSKNVQDPWSDRLADWNDKIKSGQGALVAQDLAQVPFGSIPTLYLGKIANLCWRTNRPDLGLRHLVAEIRRQQNHNRIETPEHFAEYASCLGDLGALGEARKILGMVTHSFGKSKFYLALLNFKEWKYEESIPLLESYIPTVEDEYHGIVARVNLAASYAMSGQYDLSLKNIEECKKYLTLHQRFLLLGSCFEIQAQNHFFSGDFDGALKLLDAAESYLAQSKGLSWLYCQKWKELCRLSKIKKTGKRLKEEYFYGLFDLRKKAIESKAWESVRDIDLFIFSFRGNPALMNSLYYSTPFHSFRERVLKMGKDIGFFPQKGQHLFRRADSFGGEVSEASPVKAIDLTEMIHPKNRSLTALEKSLMLLLFSDRYAPFRTGHIFSKIFEGEYLNLDTSPNRVFQIITSLKGKLNRMGFNSEINKSKFGYSFSIFEGETWSLSTQLAEVSEYSKEAIVEVFLRERFQSQEFSAEEVSNVLSISRRTANRIILELEKNATVQVLAQGSQARYKMSA